MSALVLPARSPLKPERAWDVPRPAGSRHRSPWWRKLLGGRDGLTRLQPGACCGCTASCSWTCASVALSFTQGTALTLAWTSCAGHSGSISLAWTSALTRTGTPGWQGILPICCPSMSATYISVTCQGSFAMVAGIGGYSATGCTLDCSSNSSVTSSVVTWTGICNCVGTGICPNGPLSGCPQYCNGLNCGTLDYFDNFTLSQ